MKPEEIKRHVELSQNEINMAQKRIAQLQTICKHEKTFHGPYQARIGQILDAKICQYCCKLINYADYPSLQSTNGNII